MVETFDLSSYECEQLPQFLWRVTHSETQSLGYMASDSTQTFQNPGHLKDAVSIHIHWRHRPSCFLSTFSDRDHAINWAKDRFRRNTQAGTTPDDQIVEIHEIDTTNLSIGTHVIAMDWLKSALHLTYDYSKHEYLILHRIPTESVVRVQSLSEIEEEERTAALSTSVLSSKTVRLSKHTTSLGSPPFSKPSPRCSRNAVSSSHTTASGASEAGLRLRAIGEAASTVSNELANVAETVATFVQLQAELENTTSVDDPEHKQVLSRLVDTQNASPPAVANRAAKDLKPTHPLIVSSSPVSLKKSIRPKTQLPF
ncbi:hypothetical protein J7T55_002026 [Diaporthe amygdali]|uniref:uncharacterized protein n=1 Tax=Phomopsis amygdali TaxID=1214568 RepID=UPI0022FEE05A|nr:uncharacterized protein J7T55_002026 [Diaporthe amygdali]KAJ0100683.1 hypothetical protein J7T55_002026 [Diaporthe amygdali]